MAKWKMFYLSQNTRYNFEVIQYILLNKVVNLNLLYLENVGHAEITELMLFSTNMAQAEDVTTKICISFRR